MDGMHDLTVCMLTRRLKDWSAPAVSVYCLTAVASFAQHSLSWLATDTALHCFFVLQISPGH